MMSFHISTTLRVVISAAIPFSVCNGVTVPLLVVTTSSTWLPTFFCSFRTFLFADDGRVNVLNGSEILD
ncbi:hypothetical protein M422DRAFT_26865 [Sphaerobolus stellatus SS14]|nr:hypothetical protein M422DRAFT_26865 [Sphaerobolus stellatus SS14]